MEAGERRRGAALSAALLALSALALLLLLLMLPPPPPPALRAGSELPPGLLEELRQRRRDLRRLAAGGAAAEGGLRCGDVRRAAGAAPVLGSGFTKVVVRAALAGGGAVALKSVHGAGREVRQCEQRYGAPAGCRRLAAYKLLKEVTLLRRLRHPGIVQVRRGRGCRLRGGTGSLTAAPLCSCTGSATTAAESPKPGSRPCWSWELRWR